MRAYKKYYKKQTNKPKPQKASFVATVKIQNAKIMEISFRRKFEINYLKNSVLRKY